MRELDGTSGKLNTHAMLHVFRDCGVLNERERGVKTDIVLPLTDPWLTGGWA